MTDTAFWQTKLAARLHDPGEKALILMRTREGHEGGTVRTLRQRLGLDAVNEAPLRRADWWASAADRPQWPRTLRDVVRWTQEPVLYHPVSGELFDLSRSGRLRDTDPEDIAARSLAHFSRLIEACDGDARKTLLAFWRFGPELAETDDDGKLGALWEQLPADTRVPDHTIWEHLDLTSAFAGAFAADRRGEAALLALSIGPVQPFIAAGRSTSDLWAGSHLLARLAWEAMKPLVAELGPDAVLFPRLRGVPQVDLWLRDEGGVSAQLFERVTWNRKLTDANPLFAAALPNRFVALVPAGRARAMAEHCRDSVRQWLQQIGQKVVKRLLDEAGCPSTGEVYGFEQARRQLADFPEVHWAAVPFSLIRTSADGQRIEDTVALSEAMAPFFGVEPGQPCGFLASEAWQVLQRDALWEDGTAFYRPNAGVLYPAVYELAERVMAAAKSVRPFSQSSEQGWRDSLTGEQEWLTTDRAQLALPPGQRSETLWTRVAERRPSWARKGEHLGALSAVKRLWPTLFAEELGDCLGGGSRVSRFVVSTHTMALAHQVDQWLARGGPVTAEFDQAAESCGPERVALPERLVRRHRNSESAIAQAGRLLALMERAQELDDDHKAERLYHIVRETLAQGSGNRGAFRRETYYGLLLMDGDRMGRILAGDDEAALRYQDCFHPRLQREFATQAARNTRLREYGNTRRAVSPGRHMVISGALNDFALYLVPHIVQREYLGRLIYGGGDDVLAMFPVADLLPAAARLRDAWSGESRYAPQDDQDAERQKLKLSGGFAFLEERLLRTMGTRSTASAGLVVAHYQTPLARVLRELRAAEQAAKHDGGRDALHIRVMKRSGGAAVLTLKWHEVGVLDRLVAFLREPAVSRRAAYHSQQWLRDLPAPQGGSEMLATLLRYQFERQSGGAASTVVEKHGLKSLTADLARLAAEPGRNESLRWTINVLSVAEFLARESRTAGGESCPTRQQGGEAA